ncbi:MAG: hypothetical protein J2P25_05470 [Nocardiopsaceae bacterium]|nr:hypothetical protein [Nocardiopsaceae bacterium]
MVDIMWEDGRPPVLVELDDRRRTALGRVGHKEHTRYLVEERSDGTLIWRPAVVVPEHELRFMQAHPEAYAEVRRQQAAPDPARRQPRPAREPRKTRETEGTREAPEIREARGARDRAKAEAVPA